MAGFAAQGATFTFAGSRGQIKANVTSISVNLPQAEVVDMTSPLDPLGYRVMVPTGDVSGGSIDVEYIASANGGQADRYIGDYGPLTFSTPSMQITKQVVLSGAGVDARVGDLVRGTLRFVLTDYAEAPT
jgi:hypothetical protein